MPDARFSLVSLTRSSLRNIGEVIISCNVFFTANGDDNARRKHIRYGRDNDLVAQDRNETINYQPIFITIMLIFGFGVADLLISLLLIQLGNCKRIGGEVASSRSTSRRIARDSGTLRYNNLKDHFI